MRQRFRINTLADPQALPRVLSCFAQRSLVPQRVRSEMIDGHLQIVVDFGDLDPDVADLLAARLGESVLVLSSTRHGEPVSVAA